MAFCSVRLAIVYLLGNRYSVMDNHLIVSQICTPAWQTISQAMNYFVLTSTNLRLTPLTMT